MRSARFVLVVAVAAAASGCFEPPVRETLQIRFLAAGGAVVVTDVRLGPVGSYDRRPQVLERLRDLETAVREGRDPWASRIAAAGPEAQRTVLEESKGRLERATRHVLLSEGGAVERFFADTGVRVSVRSGDGWGEVSLLPDASGGASAQERRLVEARLETWVPAAVAYLGSVERLYAYLDARPERARDILGGFFEDVLDDTTKESLGPLSENEEALLERVHGTTGDVIAVLSVEEDQAYTLDEISRRVYDPFPSPLALAVPGPVVEREGFAGALQDPLVVRSLSLWNAFAALDGRWIEPDPLVAWIRHDLEGRSARFDLDAFVSRPRRHRAPPEVAEFRRSLEAGLKPEPFYRVRWSTVGLEPEDLESLADEWWYRAPTAVR